ncbi:MAG: membrane dipeptidase [Anaerolineae bacterium]|nr:membrane dipeptidase [Anaerolineae bacterium]
MSYEELHRDALVVDSHNDTIVAHIRRGNLSLAQGDQGVEGRFSGTISFLRGHESPREGAEPIQINFPKMLQGGIDAGFFAVDVTLARHNHLAYAMDGFGYLFRDLEQSGAAAAIVRRANDILRARQQGTPAIVLAIEHADGTEHSLNVLRSLYELGVRSIGLTHNVSSAAADGNLEARDGVGLTHYGRALVQEMNRLGMLVDLAHVSPSAFFSALEVTTRPVIFSHGNARALCDHPRNLSDDQLRALARNGGVIGLSFVPMFVDKRNPSLERFLDHVDHVARVAGVESVSIGSDFDGGGTLLPDATHMPRITAGLLERGYGEADIRRILGENTLRVLGDAIGR